MELIADGLLIAGAFAAGFYCWMLSRRLRSLKSLDSGLGKSIATLSNQIEDIKSSLEEVRQASNDKHRELAETSARAEVVAGRLELLLASIHEGDMQTPVEVNKIRESREKAIEPDQTVDPSENSQDALLNTLRQFVEGMGR